MSKWTAVCTHAHTDYGLASSQKLVEYAASDKPTRPCCYVAMVPLYSVGSPNVTKLRAMARKHPATIEIKVYDPANDASMERSVREITERCGDAGINLLYTCPDWCEEDVGSGLNDTTQESLARTFHHNCVVPVLLSKLFYPALKQASKANEGLPINRRRAAIVHMIGEAGTLGDFENVEGTRGQMYGYSASLAAMIMSMKTMSHELKKRNDGILVRGVIMDSPHVTRDYDVIATRDLVSKVVHESGEEHHGKCLHFRGGDDVSY